MPIEKQRRSSNNSGADSRATSNNSSTTERESNDSEIGATALDPRESLNTTTGMIMKLQINENPTINQICQKHEIQPKMSKHFLKLPAFEIVILCDDSSSMKNPTDNPAITRWNELCSMVKIMIEIAVVFDEDGVDVYFLNRKPILNVNDPAAVDQEFRTPPDGHTPLASVLKKIFETKSAHSQRNKNLLVLVATDGEPTNEYGVPNIRELKHVMTKIRQVETTYVSFLICTDDADAVQYLRGWDISMENVDIIDDYITERNKIRQHRGHNSRFSRGDYIVKAMMGSIVPELDHLDEPDE